jgi:thiamine pyrophosphokinase
LAAAQSLNRMKALLFANGEPNPGLMVQRALASAENARIIAADGGARIAHKYGYRVDTVIGDMDSLSELELQMLQHYGAVVHRYPPEKDETDLELALKFAAEQHISWLRIIGGVGGRVDQVLSNIYLLALPELHDMDVGLVAGNQAIYLLRTGEHHLQGVAGDTVSLLPMGGDVHGITTDDLQYPLHGETLQFGPARGISNVMLHDIATVTLTSGLLLVVHTIGRA